MPTDSLVDWLMRLEGLLPVIAVIVGCTALFVMLTISTLNLLDVWRVRWSKHVLLEITPPANTNKAPQATAQLFSVLYGLLDSRPFLHKLLRRKPVFSLEVVSTRKEGIRFLVRVTEAEALNYEHIILAYIPDARVKRVEDYVSDADGKLTRVLSFRQPGHFAYPLRSQGSLEEHDPIAYLGSAMTKLKDDELVAFQLVVSPVRYREAVILQNRITHSELLITKLGGQRLPMAKVLSALSGILFWFTDAIGDIFHGPGHTYSPAIQAAQRRQDVAAKIKPARSLSPIEQQLADSVQYKLSQPQFRVDIRALVVSGNSDGARQRVSGIRQALGALSVPKYQVLKKRLPYPGSAKWRLRAFRYRLPSVWTKSTSILASSELASLYHFPHSLSGKTENVVKSLSKQLPAPISLKNGAKLDVVLGRNHYHGQTTDIGLTAAERERHMYVIGGTGNGKTTMLEYAVVQDIQNGKGVAVIDPHGDMAEKLLGYIPEDRIKDVIYFNPRDLAHPIGLNLLELPEGLEGDELLNAKDFVTESVVSIMRKLFSEDDSGGHRIEYMLRNATQTALTQPDATLFTIYDLFTDAKYRRKVMNSLTDERLKNFWKSEFGRAGGMQQVKMAAGVTHKIGRFLFSASAKRIIEQPKSTINFDDILNGKILICNLAKGKLGEDTSAMYGVSILTKLQLAAYRRAEVPRSERIPFYVYVDEFQNFATPSFVQLLSEARKYKVYLTMAEQSTSQQDEQRMVQNILANVGTVICFKTANPADEELLLPRFKPYVQEGEITYLPTYNFYAQLGAVHSQEPMSGETLLLEHDGSAEVAKKVVEISRKTWATKVVAEGMPGDGKPEPKKRRTKQHGDSGENTEKPTSAIG
ncbi:type IV secretion system DNA-binding domain-containing protein [Candidatus Saccharibacteria bacterium]|nr:type IV secretion system DNA-binding domain-containing protein [Candidatus Saccharibacteria bacterium]